MHICPVCGYDRLTEQPYDSYGCASFEICSCCGFEFGYDDLDQGMTFEKYRVKWIKNNYHWFNEDKKPIDWDLAQQLKNITKQ